MRSRPARWQPEFNPWNIKWKEGPDSTELFSGIPYTHLCYEDQ